MAPVVCEVFFPEFLFVLLDFCVNLFVKSRDVRVFVVALSECVALFNEVTYVFWEEFVFVLYFAVWYVVFVCVEDGVDEDVVGVVDVCWWLHVREYVFYFLSECIPICFSIVCVGVSVLCKSVICFGIVCHEDGEMV